jgi:hypothetical protein
MLAAALTRQQSEASSKQAMVEQFRVAYEERRRIHNALQEQRGNVRVLCRVRPLPGDMASAVRCGRMEDGTPSQVRCCIDGGGTVRSRAATVTLMCIGVCGGRGCRRRCRAGVHSRCASGP